MQFSGEFETHITVSLNEPRRIDELQRWGARQGMHCLYILLERGDTKSQPMLTRHGHGDFLTELQKAAELHQSLEAEGFPVVRVKIEASLDAHGVPQTGTEAMSYPAGLYFEHHVKLVVGSGDDLSSLTDLATRHGAHLSRNALRVREDGLNERFITQRCFSAGRVEARRKLEALLDAISASGHLVMKIEEEFVVYDNNLALDAGWIS